MRVARRHAWSRDLLRGEQFGRAGRRDEYAGIQHALIEFCARKQVFVIHQVPCLEWGDREEGADVAVGLALLGRGEEAARRSPSRARFSG